MKWLIASDIHGSAKWAEQLVRRFDECGADRMLLLGDILYHGPRNALPEDYDPPRVAAMLNARAERICCVRGNCDSEVDQMMLGFPITSDYLYIPVGTRMCFATHGHVFNEDTPPKLKKGDLLLHGHTHVPACVEKSGVRYLNPGSISLPKEDSPRGYMTLEGSRFTWKTLDGEVWQTWEA